MGLEKIQLLIFLIKKKIFNLDNIQMYKSIYKISGYGNNTIEVEISNSDYHIIIEPNNTGFDKYLVQKLLKIISKINQ